MFTAGSLLAMCILATAPMTTVAINTGNFLRGGSTAQIINGTEVEDEAAEYSFFVLPSADENTNRWLGCGASIISPTWGLTAAHCFGGGLNPCSDPSHPTKKVKLWMGDLHLSNFEISGETGENKKHAVIEAEVVCHPQFDGKCSHGHDMTLLRLTKKVPDWVKPVPLDLGGTGLTRGASKEGEVTTNIGFGNTETSGDVQLISDTPPLKMREAELTIFKDDYKACASVYAGGFGCSDPESEGKATNLEQQLCAGATDNPQRDTCSGDSGSPMLDKNGVQIGIVSYGGGPGEKRRGPGRMCADPEYMGVYTRVSAFAEFIHKHVKDLPSSTGTTQSSSHI